MTRREPVLGDYHFELPPGAIAQRPVPDRTDARLLVLEQTAEAPRDAWIHQLPEILRGDELLVLNDTRVVPARLRGRKETGGRVELLALEPRDDSTFAAIGRASKGFSPGLAIQLEAPSGGAAGEAAVLDLPPLYIEDVGAGGALVVRLPPGVDDVWQLCDIAGQIPLPPYIGRPPEALDSARYQTIFARERGAVAAPTAGLHFTAELLEALARRGCETAFVTLHVGPGTFSPVRVERLSDHRMHAERFRVPEVTAERIARARREGRPILAVGTTVVRTLEAVAATHGEVVPAAGSTDLFIREGHRFRVVDQLLTNFHLPGSTLLVLVSAFAGRERVLAAYRHAVDSGYRFFSYGDGMLLR